VAALGPLAERLDAHWVGWPGDAASIDDAGRRALLASWERDRGIIAVELPAALTEKFYDGYSNSTLWPLLHGFPGLVQFDRSTWLAYRDANELFARAVVDHYRPGDLIWVHDYQLALVPELVRERLPDAAIGFFLHVPFAGSDSFRILPDREAFLRGMLGADLVAFQTHGHLHDFRRALLEVLALGSRMDRVDLEGRTVSLAALPIGIVTSEWQRLLDAPRIRDSIRHRLEASSAANVQTILAVDRLDYTKGIPERLRAFRLLLRRNPRWHRRVQLIQVAVPSRERIPRYAELRRTVSELVGEINGEFATADWTPVVYLRRSIDQAELATLYATAEVAWVAPLRDGMNLVAKEYVEAQAERGGVLVLSEFAGAAQELGEAIRVNPYDTDRSADAIERALTMPQAERIERQAALLARVRRNDAPAWSDRFLASLRQAAANRSSETPTASPPDAELAAHARDAANRAFYLDYDGTLVAIAARPEEAVPTDAALDVIERLTADRTNEVIIMSGRSRVDLARWFGRFERLWLVAEHGAILRDPTTGEWRPLHPGADTRWKDQVRPVMVHFTDRAPGSFVEEKEYGLAWHYRLADPEFGAFLAGEVVSLLDQQLAGTDLVSIAGRKVVEVRFAWANKGDAALAIRGTIGRPGFELAIGDDRTDEDLFDRLPSTASTVHVGRGPSRARYRVRDPDEVLRLLGAIASLDTVEPAVTSSRPPRSGRRASTQVGQTGQASSAGSDRRARRRAPG
jgi:trehalose 6-phosphate synthase/phosphatase